MKNSVFLVFCLMIVTALVSAFALFKGALSPVPRLEKQIAALKNEKHEADLRAQLVAFQFGDYQQQVATLLPSAIKELSREDAYPLRQLASVIAGNEGSALSIERASGLMEKAKAAFREKKFEESNRLFARLIEKFPSSSHVPEAHFLLAEGQFQGRAYELSVATIERMVDTFPENELTGFALLRLGAIFESQDRLEDAGDIYRSVLSNFPQKELNGQAALSLRGVEL